MHMAPNMTCPTGLDKLPWVPLMLGDFVAATAPSAAGTNVQLIELSARLASEPLPTTSDYKAVPVGRTDWIVKKVRSCAPGPSTPVIQYNLRLTPGGAPVSVEWCGLVLVSSQEVAEQGALSCARPEDVV